MQLLKLVYMAHGWHLAALGEPLIPDYAYAWDHGPVIPNVYFSFRPYGVQMKQEFDLAVEPDIASASQGVIRHAYNQYGWMSAKQMSMLTHIAGGPWDRTRKKYGKRARISNDWIREHWLDKMERAQASETV